MHHDIVLAQLLDRRLSLIWLLPERARVSSTNSTNPFVRLPTTWLLLLPSVLPLTSFPPSPLPPTSFPLCRSPTSNRTNSVSKRAFATPSRSTFSKKKRSKPPQTVTSLVSSGTGRTQARRRRLLCGFVSSFPLLSCRGGTDDSVFPVSRASSARSSFITSFRVSSSGRNAGGRTTARSCRLWSRTWKG
jgi:hypothetical protein